MTRSLSGSKSMLRDGAGIRIILQPARNIELPAKDGNNRHIHPRGKVWRRLNHSDSAVQRTSTTDTNRCKLYFVDIVRTDKFVNIFLNQIENAIWTLFC